ncbi:MAG TPA: SMR family transporter [Bryobacteraceae bacterium]|nr:SMR family transporter [Bryobacteraceae bacterium]
MNAALLVAAAVAFTAGGVAMKYSAGLTRMWPSALVFALFCAGAAAQALAMRRAEMAATYIVVLGMESVLAFGLGVVVFREPATPARIVAVALVTAGIVMLKW